MNKKDLIQFCLYYKGQNDNPFTEGDKASFWEYEKKWIDLNFDDSGRKYLAELIGSYTDDGLALFEIHDDTPVSLKALLYNRYCQWLQGSADEFRRWYKKAYRK